MGNTRTDVQWLRGLAVVSVIFYHAGEKYLPNGFLGVDIFFVISGYVIVPKIVEIFEKKESMKAKFSNIRIFYSKRFYRLIPSLASTVTITLLLINIFGNFQDYSKIAKQGIFSIIGLGNYGASKFAGNYFSPNPNPLIHIWSLAVELQIYVALPLVLFLFLGRSLYSNHKLLRILLFSFVLSLISFSYLYFVNLIQSDYVTGLSDNIIFYSPFSRVWQFLFGGMLFFISRKKKDSNFFVKFLIFTSMLLLIAAPINFANTLSSILVTFISGAAIYTKALTILPRIINSTLNWIGDRSYSIYLFHMPLIYVAKYSSVFTFNSEIQSASFGQSRMIQTFISVLLSFVLGALNYNLVESRYRKFYLKNQSPINYLRQFVMWFLLPLFCSTLILLEIPKLSSVASRPYPTSVPSYDWDDECDVLSEKSLKPCEYLVRNPKGTLILIGDSHAASISKMIVGVANRENFNAFVWTSGSCPFILPGMISRVSFLPDFFPNEKCLFRNQSILRWIDLNKPTHLVYTHLNSGGYFAATENVQHDFNKLLAKGVLILKDRVNEIILFGPTPQKNYSNNLLDVLIGKLSVDSPAPFRDEKFWKNFSSSKSLKYISSLSAMCEGDVCKDKNNEGWLFEDGQHVSLLGANLLKGPFQDSLSD